ncbi:hypothetical protein [Gordonia sp. CNJ-863]|uniref:hypothetical protein n=1 Tax=Gordonia sp. CNJ-863 TaxID=1904963 RepID=UPI0013018F61|nr:hypothetical protein [Gordonia sp. CNJ-863]
MQTFEVRGVGEFSVGVGLYGLVESFLVKRGFFDRGRIVDGGGFLDRNVFGSDILGGVFYSGLLGGVLCGDDLVGGDLDGGVLVLQGVDLDRRVLVGGPQIGIYGVVLRVHRVDLAIGAALRCAHGVAVLPVRECDLRAAGRTQVARLTRS